MITRLLLHVVDPSIQFTEMTGREANLKYISQQVGEKMHVISMCGKRGEGRGNTLKDILVFRILYSAFNLFFFD